MQDTGQTGHQASAAQSRAWQPTLPPGAATENRWVPTQAPPRRLSGDTGLGPELLTKGLPESRPVPGQVGGAQGFAERAGALGRPALAWRPPGHKCCLPGSTFSLKTTIRPSVHMLCPHQGHEWGEARAWHRHPRRAPRSDSQRPSTSWPGAPGPSRPQWGAGRSSCGRAGRVRALTSGVTALVFKAPSQTSTVRVSPAAQQLHGLSVPSRPSRLCWFTSNSAVNHAAGHLAQLLPRKLTCRETTALRTSPDLGPSLPEAHGAGGAGSSPWR